MVVHSRADGGACGGRPRFKTPWLAATVDGLLAGCRARGGLGVDVLVMKSLAPEHLSLLIIDYRCTSTVYHSPVVGT
jgi:hypothetical protein